MTGSFDELVRERMALDPAFAEALRTEALEAIRTGDIETGESMLRKYFGATGADLAAELTAAK